MCAILCALSVTITFLLLCVKYKTPEQQIVKCGSLEKVWGGSSINNSFSIRLLILRHTPEQMAIGDANLAKRGVTRAQEKGLDIKVIGDELVRSLDDVRRVVNEKISIESTPGDTLIIHTIGHGHGSGMLQNLGNRKGVMQVFVDAAVRNQQETLWWQLSCHASAHLPGMDTLNTNQQDLFSNLASSTASQVSAAGIQGKIMEKVFVAMAERDKRLDADGDEIITAEELKNFLNGIDGRRRGDLLFARNAREPIFGTFGPWLLPIIDRIGPNKEYKRNFIPMPSWRAI